MTDNFNDVLQEHEKMIHYLIHKLKIRDLEKEFYQEGVIALWKATETYDKNRGKFSSYAYFHIEKTMLSLIRKQNRQAEQQYAYIAQLSTEASQMAAVLETDFDPYLLNTIKQTLTENQLKWFILFIMEDMSIKQIARREQVNIDTVKYWARHAKPKLQKLLTGEYYSLFM